MKWTRNKFRLPIQKEIDGSICDGFSGSQHFIIIARLCDRLLSEGFGEERKRKSEKERERKSEKERERKREMERGKERREENRERERERREENRERKRKKTEK